MKKMWELYAALTLGAMLFATSCGKSDNPPPIPIKDAAATTAPAGREQPVAPMCQSCAMPMVNPEDFGTNVDKNPCPDYCCHCFQNGAFTAPDVTCDQMIDMCTGIMCKNMNMPEPQAREMIKNCIPQLKRWQKQMQETPPKSS
ncbi:MAG: zinc ribbon domain-containing protein [Planctomycetota bacterium]